MSEKSLVELEKLEDTYVHARFEIKLRLGSGSFGIVYKLQSLRDPRQIYACKYSQKRYIDREKKFMEKLRHKHVVRCYKFKSETFMNAKNDILQVGFMFMEWCRSDLETFLRKNVDIVFETRRTLMRQIAEGLQYIHAQRIIHRDLKPGNILVDARNVVKISDFGCAKFCRETPDQKMSFHVGTLWYQAPEILRRERYDYAIDLWSLGCIYGEMFTGRALFRRDTRHQQLRKITRSCDSKAESGFGTRLRSFFGLGQPTNRKIIVTKLFRVIPLTEFADLINGLLELNQEQRFSIQDVLKHSFFKFDSNIEIL